MKKKLCVKLVIYKDCNEMHGQQNIKFNQISFKIVHKSDDIIFYSAKHLLFVLDDIHTYCVTYSSHKFNFLHRDISPELYQSMSLKELVKSCGKRKSYP